MDVIEAIKARHSVRAFLDKPVELELVDKILEAARFTASGVNTQPWHVAVLQGQSLKRLGDEILAARAAGIPDNPDYQYYPKEWFEPFKTRRVECGAALYGALGIDRKDMDRRQEQWNKNYRFFGAPIGLIIFIDRHLGTGSWLDLGMFINAITLAALDFELGSCAQASIAEHPQIVREVLNIEESWSVACGIALGYENKNDPVNQYRTSREPVENFTLWYD